MERVGTLINKLKEQFDQQADAQKMALTAQLLLSELQQKQAPAVAGNNITVVMPSVNTNVQREQATLDAQPISENPSINTFANGWLFEEPAEIPTLTHQKQVVVTENIPPIKKKQENFIEEYNTLHAKEIENLNEKLREEKQEVATLLQEAPIRDLKKAIGLNDRFLFVNDLFRGDENMYERSLKTINAFNIYPEAEYWIQRELKVKLSWPDNSDSAKLFNQLVRRRFASI